MASVWHQGTISIYVKEKLKSHLHVRPTVIGNPVISIASRDNYIIRLQLVDEGKRQYRLLLIFKKYT